jgi:carbamoyltransferase
MRNYIGLGNSFHDPALAIVNSKGTVVFAEGTERYLQNKRALGAPPDDAIRIGDLLAQYCEPGAEFVFAKTWGRSTIEELRKRSGKMFRNITEGKTGQVDSFSSAFLSRLGFNVEQPDHDGARYFAGICQWLTEMSFDSQRERASSSLRFRLRERSAPYAETATERVYDHHLTHAATACWSSSFDEAVCAVIDGNGDAFQANSFFRYERGRIDSIPSPRDACGSLGHFYALLCATCGFDWVKGEEWKVMGLAPYGRLNRELYDIMRPMLAHCTLGLRPSRDFVDRVSRLLELRRRKDSDPREAADLAFTGQQVFCEWSRMLLEDLSNLGLSKNLILTGGCALNSSWNGRILEETGFERLHVFLGELASKHTLELAVTMGGLTNTLPPGRCVPEFAAELLAAGKIVGWVQGRAEFGPRALGNRSILADPRHPEMKDRINARVKFREEYRPFAPSILHEYGAIYFENYQESPYMERTLRFRPDVRQTVPAVVHEDGTGRLQTVRPDWNRPFYDLLVAFHSLTGVPIVLNTSFNIMGKPIIHSVEDAIAVFYTTGMDALVIEDVVLQKSDLRRI